MHLYNVIRNFLVVSFAFVFLTGFSKNDSTTLSTNNSPCIENKNLYQEMIIPTHQDTVEWDKIEGRSKQTLNTRQFIYYQIPVIRGLVDTALLAANNFDSCHFFSHDYKSALIFSPLVIEGTVIKTYSEDTVDPNDHFFNTCILIKIDDILKSNYKVKKGDYVLAKTFLYRTIRNFKTKGLGSSFFVGAERYKDSQKYLFVLDKYFYMEHCYRIFIKDGESSELKDQYCPYSFSIGYTENEMSMDYQENKINKLAILEFLHSKK